MNFLFDTKFNHFLQSFQNPVLTVFMLVVSLFGSQPFLMLAAGLIFFRVGWKRGFVFIQMVLWAFILTDFLKELLYLPRPIRVDPSLLTFNEYLPNWLLESVADNPGFPSGHVCSTVVFWGAVLLIFSRTISENTSSGADNFDANLSDVSRPAFFRRCIGRILFRIANSPGRSHSVDPLTTRPIVFRKQQKHLFCRISCIPFAVECNFIFPCN